MRRSRSWVALGTAGLAMTAAATAMGAPAATATSGSHHPPITRSASASKSIARTSSSLLRSKPQGKVAAHSAVSFELVMSVRHATKEAAFLRRVSSPASKSYHHFLTDKQWQRRYGPTKAQVRVARKWLTRHHFTVGATPSDRLFVTATGTAARVDHVFNTTLGRYKVNGKTVRLTSGAVSVPGSLVTRVSGVAGLNEYLNTPDITVSGTTRAAKTASTTEPQPPSFVNPQPCSAYWGQKVDTADAPSLYTPYAGKRSYDICGYAPGQLRSAYGLQQQVSAGTNGHGVTVAIVDAYDSPSMLADAQAYEKLNDPGNIMKSSQYIDDSTKKFNEVNACGANGWWGEQTLDVEAVHAMAPGATIRYVGGKNCEDAGLLPALQKAVTSGASVVSDSWGDDAGDLLDDAATKEAYDNTFTFAGSTGVSVLFSSGDAGDNFAGLGIAAPDYPVESPWDTAVGGTALEIGANGTRNAEVGWSTGKQILCAGVSTTSCGTSSTTGSAMAYNAGGGGGTSFTYPQPYYQTGVVPTADATRNAALLGDSPSRTVPDISMDADAQTGMLVGETETFPDGSVHYGQYKIGGTSLASPLFAGVVADSTQAAGGPFGFLNPALYKAAKSVPGSIYDIVPPAVPNDSATIRVDYTNTQDASDGYNVSLRVLDYEGTETYCDGTDNCASRPVSLTTAKGYDSMTGLGTIGPAFIAAMSRF